MFGSANREAAVAITLFRGRAKEGGRTILRKTAVCTYPSTGITRPAPLVRDGPTSDMRCECSHDWYCSWRFVRDAICLSAHVYIAIACDRLRWCLMPKRESGRVRAGQASRALWQQTTFCGNPSVHVSLFAQPKHTILQWPSHSL